MAAAELHPRIAETRELAPEVRHFVFELPAGEHLDFLPGQFLTLRAGIGGRAVRRAYSIASPPGGPRFELCLNRVREGVFSPYLFDRRPGDVVEMKGPYGAFGWREPPADSVLVATGTGIAPIRAMLRARLPGDALRRYILLSGARHEYGLLYRAEFEDLAGRCRHFRFWPTVTRPEPGWAGRTGRVQLHLHEAVGSRRDLDIYICGLWEMVREVRDMLAGMGFERHRIIYERYD